MKLLPFFFSCVYSTCRLKLFLSVVNSRRRYSIFVRFIYRLEEKNSKPWVIFSLLSAVNVIHLYVTSPILILPGSTVCARSLLAVLFPTGIFVILFSKWKQTKPLWFSQQTIVWNIGVWNSWYWPGPSCSKPDLSNPGLARILISFLSVFSGEFCLYFLPFSFEHD